LHHAIGYGYRYYHQKLMNMAVPYKPAGFHTVTACTRVEDAPGCVAFLKKVFDAKDEGPELRNVKKQDGSFNVAEIRIGDSIIMVFQANQEWQANPFSVYLYVENCDEVYRRAIDGGAMSLMEPSDMFYGDRNAGIRDAWGNEWWIATHIEDIPIEELASRESKLKS